MPTPDSDTPNYEVSLTSADIYRAAEQGVLSRDDADRLVGWGLEQRVNDRGVAPSRASEVEHGRGLNFVTVAYYFGAMLMISACAWFLGDKWEELGSPGILVTVAVYMALAGGLGWWLRGRGYLIGGGLLITVAVCLTPLLTYSIQDILGIWPDEHPGDYDRYYPWIHGSWIIMEVATIVAAAIALYFVRFGFLTAPIAFSFWFLSMDLAALIAKKAHLSYETNQWISVGVGLVILLIGFGLEKLLEKPDESRSEDFAFWCFLFGMMAFWGGLTSMNSNSELNKALYALLNVGFIALAVKIRRSTFLVFGAFGVHIYLGHLAYRVFKDSFLFPFALALLGLSLILLTVWIQRRLLSRATLSHATEKV